MQLDLTTTVTEAEVEALWPVWAAVFGDVDDIAHWREQVWDRHAARDGFRLARASDGDRLLGFAYGYTGEHGQWWTDWIAGRWPEPLAAEWLGGHFELVSLGVLAAARRQGAGARLLDLLTTDLPHARRLLMTTDDADDPARRLYASRGWQVVGPAVAPGRVVLGQRGRPGHRTRTTQAGTQQIP